MKTQTLQRLSGPLLLLALTAVGQAQFNFTTNDTGITITGYTGSGGNETIPDKITDLPVTRIGGYAFFNQTNLTGITIPHSVTTIDVSAFYFCDGLTNATLGNNTVSIGSWAFCHCDNLTQVALGTNVSTLGSWAFQNCPSLTEITIPDTVTNLGAAAFAYCTSLTNVTIPKSVVSIGAGPFAACTNLDSIAVDPLNPAYRSVEGVLFNHAQTALIQFPAGRATSSYPIPNGVCRIGGSAFYNAAHLADVFIPASVTSIEGQAFRYCSGLTSVTIPGNVTNVGMAAFAACTSLTAITVDVLNSTYSSTDGVLFDHNQKTLLQYPAGKIGGRYTIPAGVTSIGGSAFFFCTSLTNVTIPNSVMSIWNWAFSSCSNLANVTIPASVTNIGNSTFQNCPGLTGIYFTGNAPSLGSSTFSGDDNATVYFLPGTGDWGATFGGRLAVLWNPQIQTGEASFGIQANQFGFNITGNPNLPVVVEACADLAHPVWSPLQSFTLADGSFKFSDSESALHPRQFYRLHWP